MLPSVGPNVIIANIALAQEDRERLLGLSFHHLRRREWRSIRYARKESVEHY